MSDRKRLEALEEAGRHTRHFLATLAHELRNPLAPIRNAVGVMRDRGIADQDLRACRDIVERQVEHLSRLVDDLFDVSRITSGKIVLQKRVIDVATAVVHAAECIRPFVDARDQTLEIVAETRSGSTGSHPIAQVVQNLLHNPEVHAARHGLLTLRRENDAAVIRVRDDGVGIATHLLSKVFDLFMQAERPVDRSEGGLGIGLTLVRQLIELHGGSVEASSEGAGRGAEFIVRIPCLGSTARRQPRPRTRRRGRGAGYAARHVASWLPTIGTAESMAMLLRLSGHEPGSPSTATPPRRWQPSTRRTVALLDIGLPSMDGYEVAGRS
jgi:signal transduction histidine kinase